MSTSSPYKRGIKNKTRQNYLSGRTMMSSRQTDDIKALSEPLKSLQIIYKASIDNKQTDTEMLVAPALIAVTG